MIDPYITNIIVEVKTLLISSDADKPDAQLSHRERGFLFFSANLYFGHSLHVHETKHQNHTEDWVVHITAWADIEGGTGGRTPLKNHKNIGFLRNTGLIPMESHKAIKTAFNVGPSSARKQNAI